MIYAIQHGYFGIFLSKKFDVRFFLPKKDMAPLMCHKYFGIYVCVFLDFCLNNSCDHYGKIILYFARGFREKELRRRRLHAE